MKHRYDRKKYPVCNLIHRFIIVIHEKLGISTQERDFQFVTSAPENMMSGVLGHLSNNNHWLYRVPRFHQFTCELFRSQI